MAEALLAVEDLGKSFGALRATDHLSLEVHHGEIHALIGPNGAGKTTLVGQLQGEIRPDHGRIRLGGRDITREPVHLRAHLGLARSFQVTSVLAGFSAADNVAMAVQARQGHSFRFWRRAWDDPRLREPAMAYLGQVGLAARAQVQVSELAHGERRQLELAMALAGRPALLLLDEPTAGMGPEDSARMVRFLGELKGSMGMLLIEHDMDAVFALADRITVLVAGRVVATGLPEEIRANADVRVAYLGEAD